MDRFKGKYRSESHRWQMWDYSAPGSYFITICAANRQCSLGKILNDEMVWSPEGKIVAEHIDLIPTYHKRILLDEWIIMPNHLHWIITLGEYDFDNGMSSIGHNEPIIIFNRESIKDDKEYLKLRRKTIISKIIGKFKMQTSKQINLLHQTPDVENWQYDYHDHVIRNNESYIKIKQYIINNPSKWENDLFYEP